MNWRNPFLIGYLSVTAVGVAALGFFAYSSYSHYAEVDASYQDAVQKLQSLQNRTPFPNVENNDKYAAYTAEYRAAYEKLLERVSKMQKGVETITPQVFQDRLRAMVSEVEDAAKQNDVKLPEGFYLGFDQYRDVLPANEAAGPLARELDAIRLVVDDLITNKVHEIVGIRRTQLPEEQGAAPKPEDTSMHRGGRQPVGSDAGPGIVTANPFDIAFIADQSQTRQALNAIVQADQFFIIRYLTIENSSLTGPKRHPDADAGATAQAAPQASPTPSADQLLSQLTGNSGSTTTAPTSEAAPQSNIRLLVGRETLKVAAHIEMITFNTPEITKK
jgi:hypothetical protein